MNKAKLLMGLFLLGGTLKAQTAPNMVKVCDEICTVTAVSVPNALWQFGQGTSWSPLSVQTYPLVANCFLSCPQFGGDPAPSITKTLYVQQQAQAFTVVWNDSTGKVTTTAIPGLPVPLVTQTAVAPDTAAVAPQAVTTAPITLPDTQMSLTVPKNGKLVFTIPGPTVPSQTLTVSGQTAPVTRNAFAFSCTGPDLQHMTCKETQ